MKQKGLSTKIWILIVILLTIAMLSCKPETSGRTSPVENTIGAKDTKITKFEASQQLKKFSSVQELREFLKNSAINQGYGGAYYGGGIRRASLDVELGESVAAPQSKATISSDSGASASEYSQTNIQVAGVDEADFVKNDNKYIYTITQNKLVIVDAFPAENAKIISETKFDAIPKNMLVNKDRLVVFAEDDEQVPVFAEYDYIPRPRYTTKTHAYVYDVSDRSSPKLVKDYNLNGNYFESRMIDNYVYFIVRDNLYYSSDAIDVPIVRSSSQRILKPEIYYFDNPEYNYNFNTVASFDIFGNNDNVDAKTFMMGYSNTIYVSKNSIYITYQKNLPYPYYQASNEERFYKVVLPLLPSDAQAKIQAVKSDDSLGSYEKWDRTSSVLADTYNNMGKNEKEELIEKIGNAISDYEAKLEIERRKTVIHKIRIDNGKIEYGSKGEVSGYLLNQFSMDEHNNNFRVATTTEFYQSKFIMYNNVYVLNDKLETIGKLEKIAPDERIYSTRFIGDRLYMVTFKRVDPLFVIDLSQPEKPEILGELKIPGFSDYLHPYDETHIIGIGKETGSNEWGGTSIKGVKLALFDVSDVKNPKELDKYEIGEAGTDSEALRDHKAFLFDKKKNVLVIPVTEVKGRQYYDNQLGYYRQRFWQGVYVFGLSPEHGFELKGKIAHNEGDEEQNYVYYGSPNAVRRALYMDDALYTVSAVKIKANDINKIGNELKEIKMPYEKARYYDDW